MDINKKDQVEIDDSNLKDFLEQDLEGLEFILNKVDDFTSDLSPIPIEKESVNEDFFKYYRKIKERKNKNL